MRISTSMIFDAGVNGISQQSSTLLHTQQQIASGRRVLTPADDPVAAAQALQVQQSVDILGQYSTNQNNAKSALGLEDAQLNGSNDLLGHIRTLAVQAGSTTLSNSDRKSIAADMRSSFNELLGIANSTDGTGQHLFAGYMGSTTPFGGTVDQLNASPANEIAYQGDSGQRRLQVSTSRQMEVSDSGNDVFKRIANGNGYFTTTYNPANTGTASIDAGSVTNPASWNSATNSRNLAVKFWTAPSGQAVGGAIIPDAGVTLNAGVNDQFNLSVDGGPATAVTVVPSATPTLPGGTLQSDVQNAIDAIPALAGKVTVSVVTVGPAPNNSHLEITSNTTGTSSSISLSAVGGNAGMATLFGAPATVGGGTTYYDLVDNATGRSLFSDTTSSAGTAGGNANTYTHVYSSGVPITFSGLAAAYNPPSNDFGATVTIAGTPASGDSFSLAASSSQSVFKTIASLINTLENGNPGNPAGSAKYATDIGTALTNLDQASGNLLRVRATIGSRLSEIDSIGNVNSDLNIQYQQTLSNLQDVDMAKALSDYARNQTSLQAAQQSFAQISKLSLFNYL